MTKGWWDRMKDEKEIRYMPCDDWDGGSEEMGEGNLTSIKEKMKTLGTRIYSSRTNSKGKDYSLGWNKNKILLYAYPLSN